MDTYEAFEKAVASTANIVKEVRTDDLAASTPCTEWDVRALFNHLLGTLYLAEGLFTDTEPRHASTPGGLPDADLVGDDLAAAYADASSAALKAMAVEGTLDAMHATPLGDMPGPILAGFTTLDVFVHGWDAAKATGQAVHLDPEVAEHVLGFAQQAITDQMRHGAIGPVLDVPSGAPVADRLMGFLGRRP